MLISHVIVWLLVVETFTLSASKRELQQLKRIALGEFTDIVEPLSTIALKWPYNRETSIDLKSKR